MMNPKLMYQITKRLADIFASMIFIVLTCPLWIIISILLKLSGEGRIFYIQPRIGFRNQPFGIWKFSTMIEGSPHMETRDYTLRDDPRVTTVGKYLRQTKINEFPQVINVLKGEMSWVGPRPLMKRSFDRYNPEIQKKIYSVLPGITGIGSVIFRDEESLLLHRGEMDTDEFYRRVINPYKGRLELWYIEHQSFTTDLLILFLTLWVIPFPHSHLPYYVFPSLPRDERILT